MGSVYEATHGTLGKQVALKVLLPEMAANAELAARFVREGRAAARIRHPHVVDVYDVGTAPTGTYLVMELLEGRDLSAELSACGSLPAPEALALLLPVFSAVSAAHRAGVIHRDLKPANVFLSCDPTGRIHPKVVDFGISKIVEEPGGMALTQSAAVLGTPYYMAPEQVQAVKNTDARSDQYALGVILFECVTGRRPFLADGLYELLVAIGSARTPSASGIAGSVPEGLSEAIQRAMSRDPADRFSSVRDFGRAVLPYADELTRALWSREFHDDTPAGNSSPQMDAIALEATVASPAHSAVVSRARQASVSSELETARSPSPSSLPKGVSRAAWVAIAVGVGVTALFLLTRERSSEPVAAQSDSATIAVAATGSGPTSPTSLGDTDTTPPPSVSSAPLAASPPSSSQSAGVVSNAPPRRPPPPARSTPSSTTAPPSQTGSGAIRGANSAWIVR